MKVSIDISLYPFRADYEPTIIAFIQRLNAHPELCVATNELSTHVTGEYDIVMPLLQAEIRETFRSGQEASFVLKILNVPIEGDGQQLSF